MMARLHPPDAVPRERLELATEFDRFTHYLFRYPAKFHPPVVRALLERYTKTGETILDGFCGSGTTLVEARALGRHSIGIDVDPVAVEVTNAKVARYVMSYLNQSAEEVLAACGRHRRSAREYARHKRVALGKQAYEQQLADVADWVPAIPYLDHWFRRYVVIDLAWIRRTIEEAAIPESHRRLFRVVFASIVRNSSNADPVPVSGLEVTKWMLEREAAGRVVDPFTLFEKAMRTALEAAGNFTKATKGSVDAWAVEADVAQLETDDVIDQVDAVLSSPPYHGAVDYYRRHQLEMYWLGLTESHQDRLDLLGHYIGRPKVPASHKWVEEPLPTALAKEWESRIREVSERRADAFRHYLTAMTLSLSSMAARLRHGGPALLVVGHSTWNSTEIPTTELFREIAGDAFTLETVLWYPVKNRYMSYERHNHASIGTEYVLVLRRTSAAS